MNDATRLTAGSGARRERAERILDVTAGLLLRHGYKRVTIDDVAAGAGIGKGTIYLHWKTREALFWAVLQRDAARLLDQLGIRYELRAYEVDENDLAAETVAAKIGLPPEQVFKTLVARPARYSARRTRYDSSAAASSRADVSRP